MKLIIQRTNDAKVKVNGDVVGSIKDGLVILVGITEQDTMEDVRVLAEKIVHLRIFEDGEQKMNLSLQDVKGSILSISQFTLYADVRKGRRPSFAKAAPPTKAEQLYEAFNKQLQSMGVHVETGKFGAMMDVELNNKGPVTIAMEAT